MFSISRLFKHLFTTQAEVRRHFTTAGLAAIEAAIAKAEAGHRGEIRFVVEAGLPPAHVLGGLTARERAIDIFSELRVWDTEQNSGVLIYVLFADHAVEIIADRGIDAKTRSSHIWQDIIETMQREFVEGHFELGALNGIAAVAEQLIKYFPPSGDNPNELNNDIVFL